MKINYIYIKFYKFVSVIVHKPCATIILKFLLAFINVNSLTCCQRNDKFAAV